MVGFEGIGRILIIVGVIVIVLGVILAFSGRLPMFGKLPGDIVIKRDGVTLYFPIVTFILISVGLTIVINLVLRFLSK